MSRIYFHSEHGEAEVSGSERAHMSLLIDPNHETMMDDGAFGRLLTAACARGDDWRLIARMHGQCELHAYVEGEDRDWFAGQIEHGLATGLLREGMDTTIYPNSGWRAVSDLLRSRDDVPVVTSYSVCEQFPNLGIVREMGTWQPTTPSWDPEDEWYGLPDAQQWATALAALRAKEDGGAWLRMQPSNWERWYSR